MVYRPCRVTLDDGSVQDRVYVVEASPYKRSWGVWPEDDSAKRSVPVERVEAIESSPTRLPAHLATKMYEAGESGMGYCVFRLVLTDGTTLDCLTGNAVDFIAWPPGVSPGDVVDLLPHAGDARSNPECVRGTEYAWCLYEPGS